MYQYIHIDAILVILHNNKATILWKKLLAIMHSFKKCNGFLKNELVEQIINNKK